MLKFRARARGFARQWGIYMRLGPLVLFAVGILCDLPAFAAQVTVLPDEKSSKGAVMISRGKGFSPLTAPTTANPGDSVMAFTGGHAKIIYPDGCTIDVNDGGAVVVVSETSPCKAGVALPTLSPGTYVVGAVIVGGGVAAAILSGGGGNEGASKNKRDHGDESASP